MLCGKRLVWAINAVCGLSIFFFGYDQGMMGGVNSAPDYVKTMGLGFVTMEGGKAVSTVTDSTKQGGIVAAYYLGTLIGCLVGGWFGDRIGRRKTIWMGCAWTLVGAPLQASAQNVGWMVAARIINGIGTGHLNVIVPVWSAEVSGHMSRGFFIALEFTLNIFGVVVAYWLEYGLSFVGDGSTQVRWRFPIAFQLVPLLGLVIAIFFMPESPRWLLKAGHRDESLAILARLRSDDGEVNNEALAEFNEIDETMRIDGGEEPSYLTMLFRSCGKLHLSRRTQLAIWIQILQEWGGIAAITVYQPVIFGLAGFDASKAGWVSGVNTITYMLSTLICVFTLDRIGRRMTLFWGGGVQAFALIMAGVFVHLLTVNPEKTPQYGGAATFMVFLYTATFGATWLTVPWVYPAEIWPVNARGKGNAMGVVGWSIGNGWCTLLVPVMFANIKENALYIFGIANIVAIAAVWAFYPETANRTLEEIDFLFFSKSPFVWHAEAEYRRHKGQLDAAVEAKSSAVHKERGSVDKEIAIFLFGYDQGMMGGVNSAPDYVKTMGLGFVTMEGGKAVSTVTDSTKQARFDCHFWKHGRIGDTMVVRDTCGAGHESSGEVFEVGPGVDGLKKGDRVAIEAGVPCGNCEFCRIGRYNACPDVVFFSTPPFHGTLTRYHAHPASWVHRIPDSMSYEEGALLEPLAVALAGIERAGLRLGDPLLICGAGPIGLVSLLAARAAGATPIVITDISQSRLDFAKQLIPEVKTVLVERGVEPKAIAEKVKEEAGLPSGIAIALECTGVESSVQTAIFANKFGGTVFVIGVGKDFQNLPFMHMSANEVDLKLQYRYANQCPKAIRLVEGGLINLKPLVTHRFMLERGIEAFETAVDVTRGAIKCQILDDAL
ncbi:uncharacterized protein JCM10292_004670 [Rhodotorula paludigena]|uniref:uncharacterized protein n=1 Tax=Rhodotorula paludigena TaxID=86838 RepID=UPI0031823A1F